MSKNVRICISTRLRNLRGTTHTIPERRWSVFFQNHMANNYFLGYVLKGQTGIAALCIGMKKPWIQGTEYYIDQFCVKPALQGGGIGSGFLKSIEAEMRKEGINAIILNTERGFPSEKFYLKNGFKPLEGLITFIK